MDLTQVLLALLTAITTVSYADTHRRLARVERDLSKVKLQLAAKPDRSQLLDIYEELRRKPDRAEFDSLRSDLTQIALALGAERPRKVE